LFQQISAFRATAAEGSCGLGLLGVSGSASMISLDSLDAMTEDDHITEKGSLLNE
jgi:hypothetical protein